MDTKPLRTSLVVACLLIGAAVLLKGAQHAGMIDAAMTARAIDAAMGLTVAFYGNFIPKNLRRTRGPEADRRMQSALRVSGWAFTLAGLGYAALAFLEPLPLAHFASIALMLAAMAISIVYGIRCYATRSV